MKVKLPFNERTIQMRGIDWTQEPLKKGDYVVLDTDYIARNLHFTIFNSDIYNRFCNIYEEEIIETAANQIKSIVKNPLVSLKNNIINVLQEIFRNDRIDK